MITLIGGIHFLKLQVKEVSNIFIKAYKLVLHYK